MFGKILIANRGEIACRIIRTCRAHGIRTVAVYAEADRGARHVALADEAVCIGPPPARESSLAIDRILAACRSTGAEAVHPGYGFLSENPDFAEALEAAGIVFIGPPARAVRAMGDKLVSKRIAREAGVSTVPGVEEPLEELEAALLAAETIGFPVMIKAAAGGGGKGMRVARDAAELREGFARARSEAESAFGDGRLFLERFIERPRHIEIQILADAHGTVVHLGERECSIQRRHQKVVEEAPSPFLDARTRAAMGEQAVALARAVGYRSAGTVEFIVDSERNFYFLEMNTRLQVEHPVTELVTGRDLVWDMIRIAAGEPLGLRQEEVRLRGWAVEARIYAEDPARGFLPSSGRLVRYREPEGEGLRVDSGVVEGDEIPIHYDPMIAKLVAHGRDRDEAVARLADALDRYVIRGPGHNVSFLSAVVGHPRFKAGDLATDFIPAVFGERFQGAELAPRRRRELAACAALMRYRLARRELAISGRIPGLKLEPEREWVVDLGGERFAVVVREDGDPAAIEVEGTALAISLAWRPGSLLASARIEDGNFHFQADPVPEGFLLRHGGAELEALVRSRRAAAFAARMPAREPPRRSRHLTAPMPGVVLQVTVAPGDPVKAGQPLVVLEAMKMENVLRAEQDGVVEEVRVAPRTTVNADQVLITFA